MLILRYKSHPIQPNFSWIGKIIIKAEYAKAGYIPTTLQYAFRNVTSKVGEMCPGFGLTQLIYCLVIYCSVTNHTNLAASNRKHGVAVSVGQESGSGFAGWFRLGPSTRLQSGCPLGLQLSGAPLGLEDLLLSTLMGMLQEAFIRSSPFLGLFHRLLMARPLPEWVIQKRKPKTKSAVFHNLTSEVTYHHSCYISLAKCGRRLHEDVTRRRWASLGVGGAIVEAELVLELVFFSTNTSERSNIPL